jgi:hypothetical protein
MVAASAAAPPLPQNPAYHLFADMRVVCGVPRFGDVVSNLAFLVVGAFGLYHVKAVQAVGVFESPRDSIPYYCFFAAVTLIGAGSAYYHWAPDTARLFWDRLPMTAAFMTFFAAIVLDRIDRHARIVWVLPASIAAGVASVVYWNWSENAGHGDLRPYILIQFGTMLILPLICLLFRESRLTDTRYVFAAIGIYGFAMLVARFDYEILALSGELISGHSVKHLIAAIACAVSLAMLRARR